MLLGTVAKTWAFVGGVGPSQDAIGGGYPAARPRLMASPATTGLSTNRPNAMMSVAIETCWRSSPITAAMPRLMASVMGMEKAISSAERQSQNPIAETNTTRIIAPKRAV